MRNLNVGDWEQEYSLFLELDDEDRCETGRYTFIEEMKVSDAEKDELQEHFERRRKKSWCELRDRWLCYCEERLLEAKQIAYRNYINGENLRPTHHMDHYLARVAQKFRDMGYSCAAISEASRYAVSQTWVIEHTQGAEGRRVRGQVIELLDEETDFDLKKWQLKGSYNTHHGKGLQDEEKKQINVLFKKGYSITSIANIVERSKSSVRRYIEQSKI